MNNKLKIAIMSDLHTDISRYKYDYNLDCDVVIVAGDSKEGGDTSSLVPYVKKGIPAIYLMGNHEYYGHEINQTRLNIRNTGRLNGVDVVDRNIVHINNVRFIGCTLWTDFRAYGNELQAINIAADYMNDYSCILIEDRTLSPADTQKLHFEDRAWLESTLETKHDGPTVIITHHGPCTRSVSPRFNRSDKLNYLNASYVSELTSIMDKYNPEVWIHGHTHDPYDYMVYNTRIVCNPRGYANYGENINWKPKIIEV